MKIRFVFCCLFLALKLSGTVAPDFTVTSSDNQILKLYQNYINQGKVVVLEAFFTTCPPCNAHAPLLQNLYSQMQTTYPGKVEFILLSTLSSDSNVKVAQYKTAKGLTMPAAGANGGSQTALQPYTSGQFGPFEGTPTFIVIAPNTGEVHFDIKGNSATQTMSLLGAKIAELLPAPPPVYCGLSDYFGGGLTEVSLAVSSPAFDTTLNVSGSYTLSGIAQLKNKNYSIRPQKDNAPLEGLTTYDLVLISKHILGIQALECEWQRLAADVNCSGSITTLDIVTARKLILGITQNLPCGSWRFVPDSATAMNGDCAQFYAVKTGDVTAGDCVALSGPPLDRSDMTLTMQDRELKAGETYSIMLSPTEARRLQGMQGVFSFDPARIAILDVSVPGVPDFDDEGYSLERAALGIVPFSWIDPQGLSIDAGASLLKLDIKALQDGRLSRSISLDQDAGLQAEAYAAEGKIYDLGLRWEEPGAPEEAGRISPNPASDGFTLSTTLDADQGCFLQMIDIRGKTVLEQVFNGVKGRNRFEVTLPRSLSGLFALRMNGRNFGKLLVI